MILLGLRAGPGAPHGQEEASCQELGHKESISKFFYELTKGLVFIVKSNCFSFHGGRWGGGGELEGRFG